jgi:serine/threonine protein phosphatase 1
VPGMADGSGRTIAIGDVHGCAHALDALVHAIAPQPADQLIFLGDLIDQGRETSTVLDHLIALQQRCQVILIQGNHEEMLAGARESENALRCWENCGGVYTLNSYRFGATIDEIPPRHVQLLASSRPYYENEKFILTHANYVPDLPMSEQTSFHLRWALFEPHEMKPHASGKTVVVGHTEQSNSEILDLGFAICIDTACWRYGWLTALDLDSREYWQASRWGVMREEEEPTHRGQLPPFFTQHMVAG